MSPVPRPWYGPGWSLAEAGVSAERTGAGRANSVSPGDSPGTSSCLLVTWGDAGVTSFEDTSKGSLRSGCRGFKNLSTDSLTHLPLKSRASFSSPWMWAWLRGTVNEQNVAEMMAYDSQERSEMASASSFLALWDHSLRESQLPWCEDTQASLIWTGPCDKDWGQRLTDGQPPHPWETSSQNHSAFPTCRNLLRYEMLTVEITTL